jgi:hypothetical protein
MVLAHLWCLRHEANMDEISDSHVVSFLVRGSFTWGLFIDAYFATGADAP